MDDNTIHLHHMVVAGTMVHHVMIIEVVKAGVFIKSLSEILVVKTTYNCSFSYSYLTSPSKGQKGYVQWDGKKKEQQQSGWR